MAKAEFQTIADLVTFFEKAWSNASSSRWTAENPAAGQCGPTALVIQDLFGGELCYTPVKSGPHFYNRIGGIRWDYTGEQFVHALKYEDIPCSRDFVFTDCTPEQYTALKVRLESLLHEAGKTASDF